MKNRKRWLALFLSMTMALNSNVMPAIAAAVDGTTAVAETSTTEENGTSETNTAQETTTGETTGETTTAEQKTERTSDEDGKATATTAAENKATEGEEENTALPVLKGIREDILGEVLFDETTKEATMKVGTYTDKITLTPVFAESIDTEGATVTYSYTDVEEEAQVIEEESVTKSVVFSDAISKGAEGTEIAITLKKGGESSIYTLKIIRIATFKKLDSVFKRNSSSVNNNFGWNAANENKFEYDLLVNSEVDSIAIRAYDDAVPVEKETATFNDSEELKGTVITAVGARTGVTWSYTPTDEDKEKGYFSVIIKNLSYKDTGIEVPEYKVNVYLTGFKEVTTSNRQIKSIDATFTPTISGRVYYSAVETTASVPSYSASTSSATAFRNKYPFVEVEKGVETTLRITGLDQTEKKGFLYLVGPDEDKTTNANNIQKCSVELPIDAYYPLTLEKGDSTIYFDYDSSAAEYTVPTFVDSGNFTLVPRVSEYIKDKKPDLSVTCTYTDTDNNKKTVTGTIDQEMELPKVINSESHKGNTLTFTYSVDGETYTFILTIKRKAIVNELKVTDQDNQEITLIQESETEFTAVMKKQATKAMISAAGGEKFIINGKETIGQYELDLTGTEEEPEVKIQINSEAEERPEYTIHFVQKLRSISLENRDVTTATLNYRTYVDGDVYYLVQKASEEAPTVETVKTDGQKIAAVEAGDHQLALTELEGQDMTLYLVLAVNDEIVTKLRRVAVDEVQLLGSIQIRNGMTTASDKQKTNFDKDGKATLILPSYGGANTNMTTYGVDGKAVSGLSITYSYNNPTTGMEISKTQSPHSIASITLNNFLTRYSVQGNDMTIVATKDGYSRTYYVHVARESYLKALSVKDTNGSDITLSPKPNFSTYNATHKTEFEATVPGDVIITATDILSASYLSEDAGITYNGVKSEDGTYKVEMKGSKPVVVTIKVDNGAEVQREYTLTLTKETGLVNFKPEVTPSDAMFTLYKGDKCEERIWANEEGIYQIKAGTQYTYMIAKSGYVGKTGSLFLTEDEERTYTLEKAADGAELNILDSDYPGFRAGEDNMSVVSSKTPVTSDTLELKWEKQIGGYTSSNSGTTPIIVDDKIYTVSADTVYVMDKETGETLKKATLAANTGYGLMPPTYADGMLFILLDGGRIQCLNAETLESLWIYKDPMSGGAYSEVRYDNGYLYVGFYASGNASFVCVSTTDEDPTDKTENKIALWRNTSLGNFYWNGAWSNEKYVFVTAKMTSGSGSTLYCLDKKSGKIMQSETLPVIKCSVSYYNGRIYFSSDDGYMYSYNLTEDGQLDLENRIAPLKFAGGSAASTPVIYNNRIYVGATTGAIMGGGGSAMMVLDVEPETGKMSIAYGVHSNGSIQTSGLVTTGYEDEDGYVYVYFLENMGYGALYMIKDKPGMTTADPASGRFYIPNHPQYCIASAVADKDGNLYLKNDSAWQYVLKRADLYLEDINVTGGNPILNGGIELYGSETDQYISVDGDTKSITLDLTANTNEADITINGKQGSRVEVELTGDITVVPVVLKKGDMVREYSFTVYRGAIVTGLSVRGTTDSVQYTVNPTFDPLTKNYTAGYDYELQTYAYVLLDTPNITDTVTCEVVSGVKDMEAGDFITVYKRSHTEKRVIGSSIMIPYAVTTAETSATVKITVTSEDGTSSRDYNLTVYTGESFPTLEEKEDAVTERTDNSAVIDVDSSKRGTLYYITKSVEEEEPTAEVIMEQGTSVDIKKGSNALNVSNLSREEQVLYMVMVDKDGTRSIVYSVAIPSTWILGDLNEDGKVTNADVSLLLDKVTAGESVALGLGDLNKDGKITNADVSMLLDKVTAGTI